MLFPRLLYISNCFYILIEKKINKKMLHFLSNETLYKQEWRFYEDFIGMKKKQKSQDVNHQGIRHGIIKIQTNK